MIRILMILFVAVLIDFVYYGVIFTFMPFINMKQLMAGLGIVIMGWEVISSRQYQMSRDIVVSAGIAVLYSLINYFSVEYNGTYDYTYANYLVSYVTWTLSAYTAMKVMLWVHGKATVALLASYLAGISAFQCWAALAIDNFEPLKTVVDSIFVIDVQFFDDIGRIYGLGTFMLDTAGIRMSLTLVMIAHVLVTNVKISSSSRSVFWLLFCYLTISGIGNIVSRTTTVGAGLGLLYLTLNSGFWRFRIYHRGIQLWSTFFSLLLVLLPVSVYLYNTSDYFYGQFRYGFEGFFNYVETGEFKTQSTDLLLMQELWPETLEEWIIGTGLYQSGVTDAGYGLLITYSGLLGFGTFVLMFVYLTLTFMRQYPAHTFMFLLLTVVGLVVWNKVATDVYCIWCFLLFLDGDPEYNPNAKHIIS